MSAYVSLLPLPKDLRDELRKYLVKHDLRVQCERSDYYTRYGYIIFLDNYLYFRFNTAQLRTFLKFIQNNKDSIETIDMLDSMLLYSNKKISYLRIDVNRFKNGIKIAAEFTFDELLTEELLNKFKTLL